MTLIELKAKAYDICAQIEYLQKQLGAVNQEIGAAFQKQQAEKKPAESTPSGI